MHTEQSKDEPITRVGTLADRLFLNVEVVAYIVLGALLAVAAALGMFDAGRQLLTAAKSAGDGEALVGTIDRLLFVLMLVEILHTVRVSFRSGTLVCEPFLVVGLIASIRRVLVITLESSQATQPGKWTPEAQLIVQSTMLELSVLGGLILIMVLSIYLIRRSSRLPRGMD
jgi:uncharacterized membrane protein (DUF373 family)